MQQVQHATRRQETGNSLYLNEPPLYQLLVSGKKAVIDLREDHLSRCARSRGRRSEGRRLEQDGVPKRREEEEEEEGRKERTEKCREKSVRKVRVPEPERRLQAGRGIHTSCHRRSGNPSSSAERPRLHRRPPLSRTRGEDTPTRGHTTRGQRPADRSLSAGQTDG